MYAKNYAKVIQKVYNYERGVVKSLVQCKLGSEHFLLLL